VSDSGRPTSNAAEVCDEFFLPALFGTWPPGWAYPADVAKAAALLPRGFKPDSSDAV
jgi:hypothetical protein